MQRVLAEEIAFGLVALAGDGEAAVADAVGIAADDRAEEGGIGLVGFEAVIAEHQRRIVPGQAQILDDRAEPDDVGGETAAPDREATHRLARLRRAENLAVLHRHARNVS